MYPFLPQASGQTVPVSPDETTESETAAPATDPLVETDTASNNEPPADGLPAMDLPAGTTVPGQQSRPVTLYEEYLFALMRMGLA